MSAGMMLVCSAQEKLTSADEWLLGTSISVYQGDQGVAGDGTAGNRAVRRAAG